MKCNLHPVELFSCFAIWIFINIFIMFKLYTSQTDILRNDPSLINGMPDLQPGWSFLSRLKDSSDVEWSSFKYYIGLSWPYLVAQFIVTEIIRNVKTCYLKHWYIISSMIFVVLHLGYKHLALVLIQPLLYAGILFTVGQKWSIWFTSLALLTFYNSLKYRSVFWLFLDHDGMHDEEVYLILFCMPWIVLRCISYSLEYIDKVSKEGSANSSVTESLLDLLSYALYVPILYMGPVILYDEFKNSFSKPVAKLSIRLKTFALEMCIFMSYSFLLDLALHYIYFYAMHADMQIVRMLPPLALCGGGLWMGAQFHVKYVINYGTTSAFARLDNMEPPPTPRCIARIHIYSEMWKYFDVGLYRFLSKYIYRPGFQVISNKYELPKLAIKMMASFATFAFVFMWHGTIKRILVWSILNYLGIILEYLGKEFYETNRYKWFKKNVLLTDTMETRFIAMLCVPLLFISVVSNFYLFAGTEVGDLFFESFYDLSFTNWNTIIISVALYCCCVVSMALQDVPSRTYLKKMKENNIYKSSQSETIMQNLAVSYSSNKIFMPPFANEKGRHNICMGLKDKA